MRGRLLGWVFKLRLEPGSAFACVQSALASELTYTNQIGCEWHFENTANQNVPFTPRIQSAP